MVISKQQSTTGSKKKRKRTSSRDHKMKNIQSMVETIVLDNMVATTTPQMFRKSVHRQVSRLVQDLLNSQVLNPNRKLYPLQILLRLRIKLNLVIELLLTRQKKTTNTTLLKNNNNSNSTKRDTTMATKKSMRTNHSDNIIKKSIIRSLDTRTPMKKMARPSLSSKTTIVGKTRKLNRKLMLKRKNYKKIKLINLVKNAKVEVAVKSSRNVTTIKMKIK